MAGRENGAGSGLGWFLAGLGIGAVVGVLYAPKAGKETREDLRNSALDAKEKAGEMYEQASQKAGEYADQGRQYYEQSRQKAGELYDQSRQKAGELYEQGRHHAHHLKEKGREYYERGRSQWTQYVEKGKAMQQEREQTRAETEAGPEAYSAPTQLDTAV